MNYTVKVIFVLLDIAIVFGKEKNIWIVFTVALCFA